jgi:hypothetical protein
MTYTPPTPRWYKLRPHETQAELWRCNKRFIVVPAGRRSGKTELAKRKLVKSLPLDTGYEDANYFAAAPTRDQAKKIYWNDLKALTPKDWITNISETELKISTIFNTHLHVIGMDKPQRIEGSPWDGGVLDEYADMKPQVWGENVRPSLSDRTGWCWLIGVPEGFNHYKDVADRAMSGLEPDWAFFTWYSSTVLPPEEIEAAKRDLDPKTFRQEYEASFESAEGQVYYAYTHENVVEKEPDPDKPIILCVDFNVDPCVWEVVQVEGHKVYVVDEIVQRNTNTEYMTKEYLSRYGKYDTIVYGDSAGGSRSTAGQSDYEIMARLGLRNQRIKKSNPAVKDRVNAVNSMLCNVNGERRLFHDPRCVELGKDFNKVVWRGQDIDKRDLQRTHSTDALGYFIEYEYGYNKYAPDPNKRFYK